MGRKSDNDPSLFLSHSSHDAGEVTRLAEALRRKVRNAYPIFCSSDQQSIPPGDKWFDYMKKALRRCQLMFCFISSHSRASTWVAFEAGFAFARKIPIIPVSIKGVPGPTPGSPLSMSQGLRIESAADLKRLMREINMHFGTSAAPARFPGRFSPEEFEHIFGSVDSGRPCSEEILDLIEIVAVELSLTSWIKRGLEDRGDNHAGLQLRYPRHAGDLLRIEFSLRELEHQVSVFNELVSELQLGDIPVTIQIQKGAKLLTPGSERDAKLASFATESRGGKYQFDSFTFDLDSSEGLVLCDAPPPLIHSTLLELVSKLRRSGVLYLR